MHTPKTHMFFDCKHQLFQVVLHLFSKFFKRCQLQSVALQIGQINFFYLSKEPLTSKILQIESIKRKKLTIISSKHSKKHYFLQLSPTLKLNIISHFANPNTSRKQLFFRTWSGFVFFLIEHPCSHNIN